MAFGLYNGCSEEGPGPTFWPGPWLTGRSEGRRNREHDSLFLSRCQSTGRARKAHEVERRRGAAAALLGLATPPPHGEACFKAIEGEKRVAKGIPVLHLARLIGGRRRDRKQLLGRARGRSARSPTKGGGSKKYLARNVFPSQSGPSNKHDSRKALREKKRPCKARVLVWWPDAPRCHTPRRGPRVCLAPNGAPNRRCPPSLSFLSIARTARPRFGI